MVAYRRRAADAGVGSGAIQARGPPIAACGERGAASDPPELPEPLGGVEMIEAGAAAETQAPGLLSFTP